MEKQEEAAIHIHHIETGETASFPLEGDVGKLSNIHWSPAGDIILFQSDYQDRQAFWAVRSDGSGQRIVLERKHTATERIGNPRWSYDGGAIYYIEAALRGRFVYDLMKARLDARTGEIDGEPHVVMSGLRIEAGGGLGIDFSISGDGKRLVYPEGTTSDNLWLVTVDEEDSDARTNARQLTNTTTMKSRAKISPDGTRVVFAMGDEAAKNIYAMRLPTEGDELTEPEQVTYMNALNDLPAWSPDGSEIAFVSTQGNEQRVWLVDADGGTPRPLEGTRVSSDANELAWAPGRRIIYRSTGLDNYTILDPRSGDERPLIGEPVPGYVFSPCWSHDGSRVAVFWNQLHGEEQVFKAWIISAEDGSRRELIDDVAWPIGWSSDDEWVYALMPGSRAGGSYDPRPVFRIPASGGERVLHAEMTFGVDGSEQVSISGDGKTIIVVKEEWQADIWLVESFDPDVE
jgi:Tol biopolymer transport system component